MNADGVRLRQDRSVIAGMTLCRADVGRVTFDELDRDARYRSDGLPRDADAIERWMAARPPR